MKMKTYRVDFSYLGFVKGCTHVYARTWLGAKCQAIRAVGLKNRVTCLGHENGKRY